MLQWFRALTGPCIARLAGRSQPVSSLFLVAPVQATHVLMLMQRAWYAAQATASASAEVVTTGNAQASAYALASARASVAASYASATAAAASYVAATGGLLVVRVCGCA